MFEKKEEGKNNGGDRLGLDQIKGHVPHVCMITVKMYSSRPGFLTDLE